MDRLKNILSRKREVAKRTDGRKTGARKKEGGWVGQRIRNA